MYAESITFRGNVKERAISRSKTYKQKETDIIFEVKNLHNFEFEMNK